MSQLDALEVKKLSRKRGVVILEKPVWFPYDTGVHGRGYETIILQTRTPSFNSERKFCTHWCGRKQPLDKPGRRCVAPAADRAHGLPAECQALGNRSFRSRLLGTSWGPGSAAPVEVSVRLASSPCAWNGSAARDTPRS